MIFLNPLEILRLEQIHTHIYAHTNAHAHHSTWTLLLKYNLSLLHKGQITTVWKTKGIN